MAGCDADALGDAGAERRRSDDFCMTSVAEDEALELVVDDDFEGELDAAVTKALFHFLRLVKRF